MRLVPVVALGAVLGFALVSLTGPASESDSDSEGEDEDEDEETEDEEDRASRSVPAALGGALVNLTALVSDSDSDSELDSELESGQFGPRFVMPPATEVRASLACRP